MAGRKTRDHDEPAAKLVETAVGRIVAALKPLRIILFGSAARNAMTADSDLDFLVVMPDGTHRRQAARTALQALMGLGIPKDVVVVTESDIDTLGGNPSLVIAPALAEGKELYRGRA